MRLVTRTSWLSASVVIAVYMLIAFSMLMDRALAVEVTGSQASGQAPQLPSPDPELISTPNPPTPVRQLSDDCFILGSRSFSIPFTVDATGTQPTEVRLFVSRGLGDSWRLLDRKRPTVVTKQFQYKAQEDGEYWFATRTIDAEGRAHPAGEIKPQLKVYVDTTKPRLVLEADADENGRVNAVLVMNDATPLKNVRLRYITDTVSQWQSVDVTRRSSDGKLQFTPPESWKLLSLQFVASDTPGNQSVVTQRVRRPRVAAAHGNRFAVQDQDSVEARSLPYRMNSLDEIHAKAVSNPVIQLDRHQRRTSPNLVTAHGFAPVPMTRPPSAAYPPASGLNAYRGAAMPTTRSVPAATSPPQLSPAPPSSAPQIAKPQITAPQVSVPKISTLPGNAPPSRPAGNNQPAAPSFSSIPNYGMTPQFTSPSSNGTSGAAQVFPSSDQRSFNQAPSGSGRPVGTKNYNAIPRVPPQSTVAPGMPFGPPSVRSATLPGNAAWTRSKLPPPATPQQIAEGFGLNSPQQAAATPSMPALAPGNSVSANPAQAGSPVGPSRARTAAEAMRPIPDASAGASAAGRPAQEEIPTPKPEPDPTRYQARRSTPIDPRLAMQRAPVRYSDSERFSLEYELEAVGNQGVEGIELYGSLDHGRSWSLWGKDPDRISPFDIETKGEGVFGFRIVVVGRNGLASPRPLAGETPDIFVVVDKAAPQVRITGAQYGEGDRIGALVIQYQCADGNLMSRPIALSFSDSPQGPWTTIAAGLENSGEYVWRADPNLPRQLYLRLDVKDQAGNVGTYILDRPIDTQGLAPRARIRGFQSLSGHDVRPPHLQRSNFRAAEGQTARRPQAAFK